MKNLLSVFSVFVFLVLASMPNASLANDGPRISEQQERYIVANVDEGLKEHKLENNGNVDLTILWPELKELFSEFYDLRLATPAEMDAFEKAYKQVEANQAKMSNAQREAAIKGLVQSTIRQLKNRPIMCIAQGQSCNEWSCCGGLVCAAKPTLEAAFRNGCQRINNSCESNSDCCSGKCEEDFHTKRKSCAPNRVCFQPQPAGANCLNNPVCASGSCSEFDRTVFGIGECTNKGASCKSNSECCSGLCQGGTCSENRICKDCLGQGKLVSGGKKCCEGLMKDSTSGKCVPAAPPIIIKIDEGYKKPLRLYVEQFIKMIVPEAEAGEDTNTVRSKLNSKEISPEEIQFTGGGSINEEAEQKAVREASTKAQQINVAGGLSKNYTFRRGSDFVACNIDFKADLYIGLKQKNVFDLMLTLLAFEYVSLGSGIQDLWKVQSTEGPSTNIHETAKAVAVESRKARQDLFTKAVAKEKDITCLCYHKNGYPNLDEGQKGFFREQCPTQYNEYLAEQELAEQLGQGDLNQNDASGIRYKEMMAKWAEATAEFEAEMADINIEVAGDLRGLSNFISSNDWGEVETREYNLYRFTVQNPNGSVAAGTALVMALLAAGVIAVAGGFAGSATLSAWAAAGIIAGSSAVGTVGVWLVSSLKGAWSTKVPLVRDDTVSGRVNYKCGKKTKCTDYNRILLQPYNKVCKKHIAANACIKSFLVVQNEEATSDEDKFKYLIDPWIPVNLDKETLIKDTKVYADLLDKGFQRAKGHLSGKRPGGKVNEGYLKAVFIEEVAAGQWAPKLNSNSEMYLVNQAMRDAVKQGAKDYALEEEFFLQEEGENLNLFANYAYEYHFVFPRLSRGDVIAYPPPGLKVYFDSVAAAIENVQEVNTQSSERLEEFAELIQKDLDITRAGFNQGDRVQSDESADGNAIANLGTEEFENGVSRIGNAELNIGNPLNAVGNLAQEAQSNLTASGALSSGSLSGSGASASGAAARKNEKRKSLDELLAKQTEDFNQQFGGTPEGQAVLAAQAKFKKKFFAPLGNKGFGPFSGGLSNQKSVAALGKRDDKSEDLGAVDFSGIKDGTGAFQVDYGAAGSGASRSKPSSGNDYGSADYGQGFKNAIGNNEVDDLTEEDRKKMTIWQIVTHRYFKKYNTLIPKRRNSID